MAVSHSIDLMTRSVDQPLMQSLATGMEILGFVTEAGHPVTATELARRAGVHQSTASRILQTLTALGFVRKTSGGFIPDYGVLSLAHSVSTFPLVVQTRGALQALADEHPQHQVNLAALFHGDMTYLLRTNAGMPPVSAWGFPLHVSSSALRTLVDLPREEALGLLRLSRRRRGWSGGPVVPSTEEGVLDWATAHVEHDVIILDGWHERSISGAIPLRTGEEHPVMLAISGERAEVDPNELAFLLHDGRRRIEAALTTPPKGQ